MPSNALLANLFKCFNLKKFDEDKWLAIRNELIEQNAASIHFLDQIVAFKRAENETKQQSCEQILLPFCQLAYLFENNGNAEEHAHKLSLLFDTPKEALNYLLNSADNSRDKDRLLVHDACLFSLPDINRIHKENWPKWKALFKSQAPSNSKFLTLFANAVEIEQFLYGNDSLKVVNRLKDIKALENELTAANRTFKKLHGKHGRLSDEQEQEYEALVKKLPELHSALALAARGLDFNDINYTILKACYEHEKNQQDGIAKYLSTQGLPAQSYAKFKALKRQDDNEKIPDILIDGAELDCPGYYLMKIPVLHDMHAARAACLGKLTNCCQSLSGEAGEPCTIHGLTSPYGGFYVLCKGNPEESLEAKVEHPVIAQTWVWRSQKNALVFDSIEGRKGLENDDKERNMVIKLFNRLARRLVDEGHTHKVACGEFSGISSSFGVVHRGMKVDRGIKQEYFVDYDGYSDANEQRTLIDKERPYIFYGYDERSTQETKQRMRDNLQGTEAISKNPFLAPLINWALLYRPAALLDELKNNASELKRDDELTKVLDCIQQYLTKEMAPETILEAIHNHSLPISIIDGQGRTLLHRAAANAESLKIILELYPEAQRLEAVMVEDRGGQTVLHYAAANAESLKIILGLYPEAQRLEAVMVKDEYGQTVLHYAADYAESLKVILERLPEKQRLEAVMVKNRFGETVLHKAAANAESLKIILELYPEAQRLEAAMVKDNNRETLLHRAAANAESLKIILELYPEAQRLEAVTAKNKDDEIVLHKAAGNAESLKIILELYPEEQRLEATKVEDNDSETVLHKAADNAGSLKIILEHLPEKQRLEAVMVKGKFGETVLHKAADNAISLKIILECLPEKQRFQAIIAKNKFGETLLHWAAANAESLKIILELYPEAQKLEAVMVKGCDGQTVLHRAAANAESLKIILELYPEAQRLEALMVKGRDGETVLHKAAVNAESLKIILELLPEKQRFQAIMAKEGKYRVTVLDTARDLIKSNPDLFNTLSKLLRKKQEVEEEETLNKSEAVLPSPSSAGFFAKKTSNSVEQPHRFCRIL